MPSFKHSFKHISSVQWVSLLTDARNHVVAAVAEIESLQKQREGISPCLFRTDLAA